MAPEKQLSRELWTNNVSPLRQNRNTESDSPIPRVGSQRGAGHRPIRFIGYLNQPQFDNSMIFSQ